MEIIGLIFMLGAFNTMYFAVNGEVKMDVIGVVFNLLLIVIWFLTALKPLGY